MKAYSHPTISATPLSLVVSIDKLQLPDKINIRLYQFSDVMVKASCIRQIKGIAALNDSYLKVPLLYDVHIK
ncbi:MAG: hypothetical protein ACOYVG_01080 [Bacteroidota bacterium]